MIRKETIHIIWVTIQAGLVMLLLGACSTTKHLPEGEILYTGSKTIVENEPQAPLTEDAYKKFRLCPHPFQDVGL